MSALILHHFDASPFSEKIRLILGYKRLSWSSVHVPRILPKPDLTPLTGGYRKTPVMQLGRDIYCDTKLIARTIDRLAPAPALIPRAHAASIRALEHIADTQLFLAAIPVLFRPAGRRALADTLGDDYLERFAQDRARLFTGGSVARPDDVFSRAIWAPAMADLDAQLSGSAYLLGDAPTLADFAVYNPVWYIRGNAGVASTLDEFSNLLAWFERMRAIGHGELQEIAATEALDIAASTDAWQPLAGGFDSELGLSPGQRILVQARDYGTDAVSGVLVYVGPETLVIETQGPGIGPIRIHFPRIGFDVTVTNA